MIANLVNVPSTKQEFLIWSFANQDHHSQIVRAFASIFRQELTPYELDPIPEFDMAGWARRHQQAHNDFTTPLGIQANDLTDIDINDKENFEAFIQLHFQEHQQAADRLGVF